MYLILTIGIDPGKSGGIAWYNGIDPVATVKMPPTEMDITEFLQSLVEPDETIVYLERVGSMPGDAGAAMFTFGRHYGYLLATLAMLRIPVIEVLPVVWKRQQSVLPTKVPVPSDASGDQRRRMKYEHKKKLKQASKDKAQKLFPHIKVTHDISEALLIMEHARFREGTRNDTPPGRTGADQDGS